MVSFIPHQFFLLIACLILPLNWNNVHGLNCWECGGNAAPLCEGKHEGKSVACPDPLAPDPPGYENDASEYQCFIMKAVPYATETPEITKGCVLNQKYFVTNVSGLNEAYLEPGASGTCFTHDDAEIYDRQVVTHEVTICICNHANNCNRYTVEDVGMEDIVAASKNTKSEASTQRGALVLPWRIIMLQIMKNLIW